MNQREKEEYLREYSLLKAQGKPFFPYAVAKDAIMAVRRDGRRSSSCRSSSAPSSGPKADPTTTTYVPRPEWYFFFLFELLRVIKPAVLMPLATIGVPTICMILLFLLPFYRPRPERRPERRPIATTAGILTIVAMAYLTYLGANAGSPNEIDMKVAAAQYEAGKLVVAQSGCLACHKIGENGNDGPGPQLTDIGDKLLPRPRSRARSTTRPRRCRRSRACRRRRSRAGRLPRALKGRSRRRTAAQRGGCRLPADRHASRRRRSGRCSTASPGVYDLMNSVMTAGLHHRWRERAADLARCRPGRPGARRRHGHRRPGDRAGAARRRRAARWSAPTSPRACSSARAQARRPGCASSRPTRSRCPTPTTSSTPATVGFGARNFSDLEQGLREMTRVVRPGGRVVVLEITTPTRPPLSTFFSLWFDRIVPAIGRLAGDPTPTRTCRTRSSASRAREALGAAMAARRAAATSAGSSPPAGSSRCTSGDGAR